MTRMRRYRANTRHPCPFHCQKSPGGGNLSHTYGLSKDVKSKTIVGMAYQHKSVWTRAEGEIDIADLTVKRGK